MQIKVLSLLSYFKLSQNVFCIVTFQQHVLFTICGCAISRLMENTPGPQVKRCRGWRRLLGFGGAASQLLARLDWPAESRRCLFVAAIKRGAPSGRWRLPIVSTPVRMTEAKDHWRRCRRRQRGPDETPSVALNFEDAGHAIGILDQQIKVLKKKRYSFQRLQFCRVCV